MCLNSEVAGKESLLKQHTKASVLRSIKRVSEDEVGSARCAVVGGGCVLSPLASATRADKLLGCAPARL